eukprot:CAMPEP_0179487910 /NCGR_PEP_ID=MMETSP0799-20121207/63740_1 /TAXON_ID=46947 /ORGANISM="Geminigera cryophila, Strain CCMP2564" /LENGTH=36 /DNA_ID= /DNA_START= /DNA_END= /DNA_ORIENTATION=
MSSPVPGLPHVRTLGSLVLASANPSRNGAIPTELSR